MNTDERKNWTAGKKDGIRETWCEDGRPWGRDNYKDGLLDGLYEWWDENGQMWGRVNYENGMLVGELPVDPNDRGTPAPRVEEHEPENN